MIKLNMCLGDVIPVSTTLHSSFAPTLPLVETSPMILLLEKATTKTSCFVLLSTRLFVSLQYD